MKSSILCSILFLSTLFIVGPTPSLEARHHHHNRFSVNFGPIFSVQPSPYIVERPPVYVQDRYYYGPYGYHERVYVQPAQRAYVYPARPVCYTGFSFGLNFF